MRRKLNGLIVSSKMDKTCVVEISYKKKHPKYQKFFQTSRRLKAHDPQNQYKKGNKVIIEEIRPLSKDKRWRIIKSVV